MTLDSSSFEKGLSGSESGFKKFGNTLKKLAIGKVVADGVKKSVSAISSLTKNVVKAYGEYEQLVGGVDTLFKKSSKTVKKYADQAYKTAGLSANKYMQTVTSFSASLLQGLNGDTAKAAKIADQAIIDMSDNANKMGTSMEAIQNAYQGFAKANYTMLDNLKLGYGGTKTEMERLLADAEKLTGIKYDINNFADVINAVHAVQTELGITGTTALEANTTIEGSFNTLKAAWDNLLIEFGKADADIPDKINKLVGAAETAFKNVLPVVKNALHGIGEFLTDIAPIIEEKLPDLIKEIMPGFIDAAGAIIHGIAEALPTIWTAITTTLGTLMDTISVELHKKSPLLGDVFDWLVQAAKDALSWAGQLIDALEDIFGYGEKDEPEFDFKFNDESTEKIEKARRAFEQLDFYNNHEVATGSVHTDNSTDIVSQAYQALYKLMDYDNDTVVTSSEFNDDASQPIRELLLEFGELFEYNDDGTITWSEHQDKSSETIRDILEKLGFLEEKSKEYDSSSTFEDGTTEGANSATESLKKLEKEGKTPKKSSGFFSNNVSTYAGKAYESLDLLKQFDNWRMETFSQHADGTSVGATYAKEALDALYKIVDTNGDGVITESEHTDDTSAAVWAAYESLQALFGIDQDEKLTWSEHDAEEAMSEIAKVMALLASLDEAGEEPYTSESSFTDGTTKGATSAYDSIEKLKNGPQGVVSKTESIHRNVVQNVVENVANAIKPATDIVTGGTEFKPAANGTGNIFQDIGNGISNLWNSIFHARSMFGGTILQGATMFGWDAQGRPQIGGGEGPEAVVGVNSLNEQIRGAVRDGLSGIVGAIAQAIGGRNEQPVYVVLDTGELVGAIGGKMDAELGKIGAWKSGGAA